jgi:phenylalanyl-tRNA synthetase alpha chain
MSDPIDQTAADALRELETVTTPDALEAFRIKFLGTKGILKALMKTLGTFPKEERPAKGLKINAANDQVTTAFEVKKASLGSAADKAPPFDLTEPGRRTPLGARHVITRTIDELTELFGRMGFGVATGPEVEDDFHNFVALNIPRQHPARDPLDNFYLESPPGTENPPLLRTQTSTVQIRVMETRKPPIRVIIPGKVYRPDTVDQTHLFQFHQLEALVIDRNVTMVDLKSTILQFVEAYFGVGTKVRFRPSFFPFTEPSAEIDVWFEDRNRWIELGGCGMVHPNVLKAVNIDPEEFSGWAFGFGIERIAMRKFGIEDIRQLVENDVRFLSQF